MNKNKTLKPYSKNEYGNYVRYSLNDFYFCIVYKHPESNIWYSTESWADDLIGKAIQFSSSQEAMASADNYLISEGFTLLTEEQWNKYKLLI